MSVCDTNCFCLASSWRSSMLISLSCVASSVAISRCRRGRAPCPVAACAAGSGRGSANSPAWELGKSSPTRASTPASRKAAPGRGSVIAAACAQPPSRNAGTSWNTGTCCGGGGAAIPRPGAPAPLPGSSRPLGTAASPAASSGNIAGAAIAQLSLPPVCERNCKAPSTTTAAARRTRVAGFAAAAMSGCFIALPIRPKWCTLRKYAPWQTTWGMGLWN
mmetsp:Transcript_50263/g.141725  ORF Transcript_50263/g.141725 Transcript_50263/m.141725 type:complete len:219 (-) Transcript_50263:2-658(-)